MGEPCPAPLRVAMRSPLPFPCVPDRPYKILLVQVGTLSFSHPSFGVPVLFIYLLTKKPMPCRAAPSPETRASPSSAGTLLSTVMLLAIVVTTTWLRTGVAHDIVRPLSNVAEIPASPARSGVKLIAGQVRG